MKTRRTTRKGIGGRLVVHLPLNLTLLSQIDQKAKEESRSQRVEMIRVLIERGLVASQKEGVSA